MMELWTFTITSGLDDDGVVRTYYQVDGDVTTSELVGEIEVTKQQLIADAIDDIKGDSEE